MNPKRVKKKKKKKLRLQINVNTETTFWAAEWVEKFPCHCFPSTQQRHKNMTEVSM